MFTQTQSYTMGKKLQAWFYKVHQCHVMNITILEESFAKGNNNKFNQEIRSTEPVIASIYVWQKMKVNLLSMVKNINIMISQSLLLLYELN